MDVPHISLNMIVRDSASTIKRAIQSVKNFVDEIIIVDTGSTDNTVEIAREMGAQVYHFDWIDDYSAARNFALEKSTGEWIFWLDDDEWVDEDNLKKLCALNFSKDFFYRTHRIVRKPKKYFSIRTHSPRLFPNRPDVRWRFRVHETAFPSLDKAGLTEQLLDIVILNEGFENERTEKTLYYKKLLEQDLAEDPNNVHLLHHLAMECKNLKLVDEALKYYGECILHIPDEATSFLKDSIPNYAELLIETNQFEKAISVILIGRDIFPDSPKLLDLHAIVEKFCGRADHAEELWKELLEMSQFTDEEDTYHPVGLQLAALDRLGSLYLEQGRIDESRECWNKALALDPEYVPAIKGIAKINRGATGQ